VREDEVAAALPGEALAASGAPPRTHPPPDDATPSDTASSPCAARKGCRPPRRRWTERGGG
jgi:hypothetical protein